MFSSHMVWGNNPFRELLGLRYWRSEGAGRVSIQFELIMIKKDFAWFFLVVICCKMVLMHCRLLLLFWSAKWRRLLTYRRGILNLILQAEYLALCCCPPVVSLRGTSSENNLVKSNQSNCSQLHSPALGEFSNPVWRDTIFHLWRSDRIFRGGMIDDH